MQNKGIGKVMRIVKRELYDYESGTATLYFDEEPSDGDVGRLIEFLTNWTDRKKTDMKYSGTFESRVYGYRK